MSESAAPSYRLDSAANSSLPTQKRSERRVATSWPAVIRLPNGTELPCIMRDASKSGAKLSVPATFPLSKSFLLKAEGRGFVFSVTLMWRKGAHAGVKIDRVAKIEVPKDQEDETG